MKWENRKRLRDALIGKEIKDVEFHSSHGFIVDLILSDSTVLRVCTYEPDSQHDPDEFYVGVNNEEL